MKMTVVLLPETTGLMFENLSTLECFREAGSSVEQTVCLRLEGGQSDANAVNLLTGRLIAYLPSTPVVRLHVTLQVEP